MNIKDKIDEIVNTCLQDAWQDYYMYDIKISDKEILSNIIKELQKLRKEI
jgi:hypothetical protein